MQIVRLPNTLNEIGHSKNLFLLAASLSDPDRGRWLTTVVGYGVMVICETRRMLVEETWLKRLRVGGVCDWGGRGGGWWEDISWLKR